MNANHTSFPSSPRTPVAMLSRNAVAAQVVQTSSRYRERDFGIGYGTSSGYALDKRYTSDWGRARFRCG
jgi:hypothetical protein